MPLVYQIKTWLLGPSSKFHIDDSVQLAEGKYIMVVVNILSKRRMKQPLIQCQWFEPETKSIKMDFFPETNLKLFDWYKR